MSATVTTAPAPTFDGKTAEQYREMARTSLRRKYESQENSDTDGFLSQWADGRLAAQYECLAKVAEDGGTIETVALFDLEGHYIPARNVEGRFGPVWVWDDAEGTHWFNESSAQSEATRIRNNAKKGVYVGVARFDAYVDRRTGNARPDVNAGPVAVVDNGQ